MNVAEQSVSSSDKTIAVNDGWALRYWTRELGVTERDLRETVAIVGPNLKDVKKLLSRQ